MSYNPESAKAEMESFPKKYAAAMGDVKKMIDNAGDTEEQLMKRMDQHHRSDADRDRISHYKDYLSRAASMLEDGKPQ
jgi:hypothetical protein